MPAQFAAPITRRRRIPAAATIAGIAVLIAAGGYAATNITGPNAHPSRLAPVPSVAVPLGNDAVRYPRENAANVFENPPARLRMMVAPSAEVRAQMDQIVRGLYGPAANRQSR
jgi:hypothetical protein